MVGMTILAWILCGVIDYDLRDFYRISFWWANIVSPSYCILLGTSWESHEQRVASSLIQVHKISKSSRMGSSNDHGL